MKVLPCGDSALLLDCATLDEAQRWFAAASRHADAVEEVVLGARTVLLRGTPATLPTLRALVSRLTPSPLDETVGAHIDVPVFYDGADLGDVARATRMTVAEVVAAHTGTPWTVAFGGFAPGFFYLVGGDPRLEVARRGTPRTSVPAGSVGLASRFSGIYPRASPGGWQLIGRTMLDLWHPARQPPALLHPGMTVGFVDAS